MNTKWMSFGLVLVNKFDTILVEDIGYKPDITRIQKALWAIPINKNLLNGGTGYSTKYPNGALNLE